MATFTKDFMFEMEQTTSDWAAYRQFIEGLRRELTVRFNLSFSHNRPILPPQQNPPTQWFDINLKKLNENRDSVRVITLRIRVCNLYLDGYQMGTSEQWMEFGTNTTPKLIPGSTPLNFDGSYVTLQRVGGLRRDDVNLSQNNFKKVVYQLATSTDSKVRAQSLLVVIQMICESIRFIRISNHLATTFKQDLTAPDWMLALENGWGDLSAALLNADADPERGFYLPPDNPMHITTAEQAVAVIAMLLRGSPSERAFLEGVVKDGKYPQRRPLVEVFSVRINDNISGQDPVDLYGTITITDGLGCQNIYNRKKENYESIHPGETALLTGPVRSISAYGSFTINMALMDDSERSPNNEFSNRQISWNVFNTTNEYDKPLFNKVDGDYGSVTVNYVVFSDAVMANVEVILISKDGKTPASVYGKLFARSDNFLNESVLFCKRPDEVIDISSGQLIPLSRSVVAVPLNCPLEVGVDLWNRDKELSSNHEIAKGTAEFLAQPSGTIENNVFGKYGEIKVKVTWS